jgi:hypothetical protein
LLKNHFLKAARFEFKDSARHTMTTKRGARNLKIVKVKSEAPVSIKLPNFPPLPRLYLELLENKEKVKPKLRDLEWESKSDGANTDYKLQQAMDFATQETDHEIVAETTPSTPRYAGNNTPPAGSSPTNSPPSSYLPEKKPNKFLLNHRLDKTPSPTASAVASPKRDSDDYFFSGNNVETPSSKYEENYDFSGGGESSYGGSNESHSTSSSSNNDGIDDRMARILRGEDEEPAAEPARRPQPQQQQAPPIGAMAAAATAGAAAAAYKSAGPPSLQQVLKGEVPGSASIMGNQNGIANLTVAGTESQNKRKSDLLFKFKLLRRSCPEANIPEFPDWTDVDTLEKEYESIVRQLRVDSTVEDWKKWLTIGCLGLEFVLINIMKWSDMAGFAQNQMLHMNKYEKILLEIGEKRSLAPSKSWPPEMRLAGMMFMNAAIFIGTKMFMQKAGGGLMSMLAGGLGGGMGGSPQPQGAAQPQQPKTKMKGPDFDIDEILKNNLPKN